MYFKLRLLLNIPEINLCVKAGCWRASIFLNRVWHDQATWQAGDAKKWYWSEAFK